MVVQGGVDHNVEIYWEQRDMEANRVGQRNFRNFTLGGVKRHVSAKYCRLR